MLPEPWTWLSGADGWSCCADPHAVTNVGRGSAEVLTVGSPGVRLLSAMPLDDDDADDVRHEHEATCSLEAPAPPSLATMILRETIDLAAMLLRRRLERTRRDA